MAQRALTGEGSPPRGARGWTTRSAALLQFREPLVERILAEAPVTAELNVRDATGSRLRPYPVLRHAQALGDLVGRE